MSARDDSRFALTWGELDVLRDRLDLPDPVLDFLERQPKLTITCDGGAIIFLSVIFGGLAAVLLFAPMGVFVFGEPGQLLVDAGLLRSKFSFDPGSWLMVTALIFSGLGGVFLAYFLYRLCLCLNSSLYFKSIASFLYPWGIADGIRRPKFEGAEGDLARWLLRGINRDLPPKEYLRRAETRFLVFLGCSALVIYEIAAGLIAFDIR